MLQLEGWKASNWIDVIENIGAKYVVFTSKHHDGFCNFATKHSKNWNVIETGKESNVVYVTIRSQTRCCVRNQKSL